MLVWSHAASEGQTGREEDVVFHTRLITKCLVTRQTSR